MIAHNKKNGLFLGITGVIILSPDSLLLRWFEGDVYTLIVGRGLSMAGLAALAMLFFPILRRGFVLTPGIIYGVVYALGLITFPLSIHHTHVANTVVILAVAPLVSAVGAKLFLKEKIATKTWVACLAAAGGLALVFAPQLAGGGGLGELMALITVVSLAACAILIRHYSQVNLTPGLIIGGLVTAALPSPFIDGEALRQGAGLVLINGAVVLAAFLFVMSASRRLSPPEVNLLFLLETALAPLWVWLALSEKPPLPTVFAGVFIAVVLVWYSSALLRDSKPPP